MIFCQLKCTKKNDCALLMNYFLLLYAISLYFDVIFEMSI